MDIQIGRVTHYYDKIGVAEIEVLTQALKIGDMVKISGHDNEFTQKVASLQQEHEHVEKVDSGDTAGMKMEKPVKTGDILYLITK